MGATSAGKEARSPPGWSAGQQSFPARVSAGLAPASYCLSETAEISIISAALLGAFCWDAEQSVASHDMFALREQAAS